MAKKPLRVVDAAERREEPKSLLEAVESGDVLEILRAQRRIIAESLTNAAENTRPQFSNELTKLTERISAEEARRETDRGERSILAGSDDDGWNSSAI